jgi:high-affinity Fe2+/Pb2+ permease
MAQMVSVQPNFQYKITWACRETEMKKALSILLVVLLLLSGGIWYFVTFQMDSMIESQIETLVSNSLGTQVSVGAVSTDIRAEFQTMVYQALE